MPIGKSDVTTKRSSGSGAFSSSTRRTRRCGIRLAEILLDRGDLDGAEQQLREAIAVEPKLVAARNALGVVALKRGDVATADREIRAAVAENPNVRLAHFNLALVAEQRGHPQEAIAEYRKEIELHPQASYKAWFNLGKVYAGLSDRAAQADAYRHAIEVNPEFAEGHLYLAKLYLDLGERFDDALSLARKGIDLAPDADDAPLGHYVIADIYSRQGRPAEAEQEAARGRALEAAAKARSRR